MSVGVTLPEDLAREVRVRVDAGEFPSFDVAVAELVRRGLLMTQRPPRPERPVPPPGPRDPGDDRPIEVRPDDVYWM